MQHLVHKSMSGGEQYTEAVFFLQDSFLENQQILIPKYY